MADIVRVECTVTVESDINIETLEPQWYVNKEGWGEGTNKGKDENGSKGEGEG